MIDMLHNVIEKRKSESNPLRNLRALKAPVNIAPNIATTKKPTKTNVIEQHQSRMQISDYSLYVSTYVSSAHLAN